MFGQGVSYTYDDVILHPGQPSRSWTTGACPSRRSPPTASWGRASWGSPAAATSRPRADLLVADAGDAEQAASLLKSSKKGKVPRVDEAGNLVAVMTREEVLRRAEFPAAGEPSLDAQGRLLCGAAVGTREGDKARVAALVEAGVDAVILDSSQGDSVFQVSMIEHIKAVHPNVKVIAGNVVTRAQARRLIDAGCDSLRVGMGSGSICTTQEVCAVGRGQATAV